MRDYTYNGVPTAQVPTDKLEELLRDGIAINDAGGMAEERAVQCARRRIEIELLIRRLNLR